MQVVYYVGRVNGLTYCVSMTWLELCRIIINRRCICHCSIPRDQHVRIHCTVAREGGTGGAGEARGRREIGIIESKVY